MPSARCLSSSSALYNMYCCQSRLKIAIKGLFRLTSSCWRISVHPPGTMTVCTELVWSFSITASVRCTLDKSITSMDSPAGLLYCQLLFHIPSIHLSISSCTVHPSFFLVGNQSTWSAFQTLNTCTSFRLV